MRRHDFFQTPIWIDTLNIDNNKLINEMKIFQKNNIGASVSNAGGYQGQNFFNQELNDNILRKIFNTYFKKQINNPVGFHYEQSVIGYEIQKNNMYYFMDMKWNALWANNKNYFNTMKKQQLTLQEFYDTNYFTHLAGHSDYHLIPTLKQ